MNSTDIRYPVHKAFTLIELLVVIAIIAILAAILFPVFAGARSKARQAVAMSNMRQIATAVMLYNQDYDEHFPRTQETLTVGEPSFINYWTAHSYEDCLNVYITMGTGGAQVGGQSGDKTSVWFDPSDPEKNQLAMWGSFANNGLVTGTMRQLSTITAPNNTIIMTLRTPAWEYYNNWNNGYQQGSCGLDAVPNPLPISNPNAPFWQSGYFDICLNPWGALEDPATGATDPFYWESGKATPPADLFPNAPHNDVTDRSYWSNGIDGRFFGSVPCSPYAGTTPPLRYPAGQLYAFVDGHVAFMPFARTYQGVNNNMWSTDQDTQLPSCWQTGGSGCVAAQ